MGISCGGKFAAGPGRTLEAANLLPGDDDLKGWKRSGEKLEALNDKELYKYIDGAAGLYLKHGFRAYAGQLYKGPKGLEVEIAIYDQGSAKNAQELYQDPMTKPSLSRMLENLGEEARIDERSLFHYAVEFIQGRFFVRVIVQDKSEDSLNIGMLFARSVAKRVK
jgi:hypothetical protein